MCNAMLDLKEIEEWRGNWIGSDVFGNGEKILVLEFSRENHHFLEEIGRAHV